MIRGNSIVGRGMTEQAGETKLRLNHNGGGSCLSRGKRHGKRVVGSLFDLFVMRASSLYGLVTQATVYSVSAVASGIIETAVALLHSVRDANEACTLRIWDGAHLSP